MPIQTDRITKTDLAKIEASLKKVIEVARDQKSRDDIDDMLRTLSQTVSELKLTVEFDHEKRLQAIEEFLQNM